MCRVLTASLVVALLCEFSVCGPCTQVSSALEGRRRSQCPDYYWRDFTGSIPHDAFVGATHDNHSLYVGQAFFTSWNLLPAQIDPNTNLAYTSAYNHYLKTNEYVKILCSPNNDVFEWVPTCSSDLHLYLNRAIPGGSEVGETIYIGRVFRENRWFIGKVFKDYRANKGLWVQPADRPHANYLTYELLVYNCNKITEEAPPTPAPSPCHCKDDDSEEVVTRRPCGGGGGGGGRIEVLVEPN